MKLNKKGAMFGLDARIALAIFGALSVISGAALYSAIQQSKVTKMIVEFTEVGKAWEAYYLDTGEELPRQHTDSLNNYFYILKADYLIEDNSVSGWKGPYLSYNNNAYNLLSSEYHYINLMTLNDSGSWGYSNNWQQGICETGDKCSLWVSISGLDSDAMAKFLDSKYDSEDGGSSGRIKWVKTNDAHKTRVFYEYAPIKNPND